MFKLHFSLISFGFMATLKTSVPVRAKKVIILHHKYSNRILTNITSENGVERLVYNINFAAIKKDNAISLLGSAPTVMTDGTNVYSARIDGMIIVSYI